MTYDNGDGKGNYGNILSKNGITYTYGDEHWKDLLTGYGDKTITYDTQGNPINYLGHTLTWEKGRQLKQFTKSDETVIDYTYNANGIRTSKKINGVTHTYTLEGTKILHETWTKDGVNYSIVPMYDNKDSVCGIQYNDEPYYFQKNLQGDIIAIVDKESNTVVQYSYDAWGVCTITEDNSGNNIAEVNSYRYRGYYFDVEIGMYYLQSRYYNPEIGKWINEDRCVSTGQGILGYNMFAYCGNNPIVHLDKKGMRLETDIDCVFHTVNTFLVILGYDTAAMGAKFLDMWKDSDGVYHAKFDCWQQDYGYNSLYDLAFDIGTSMKAVKFPFKYNCLGYTIWAWKGDYINLGAGAELGIYRGASGHRLVDKSLAMPMSMTLRYKNNLIINYSPSDFQWWITGFNPNYLNVKENQLIAKFTLRFRDCGMYKAFRKIYEGNKWWRFNTKGGCNAILEF